MTPPPKRRAKPDLEESEDKQRAPEKSTVTRSTHRMTLRSARRKEEEKKAVQSLVVSKGNNVIYDQYSSRVKSKSVQYPLAIAK